MGHFKYSNIMWNSRACGASNAKVMQGALQMIKCVSWMKCKSLRIKASEFVKVRLCVSLSPDRWTFHLCICQLLLSKVQCIKTIRFISSCIFIFIISIRAVDLNKCLNTTWNMLSCTTSMTDIAEPICTLLLCRLVLLCVISAWGNHFCFHNLLWKIYFYTSGAMFL